MLLEHYSTVQLGSFLVWILKRNDREQHFLHLHRCNKKVLFNVLHISFYPRLLSSSKVTGYDGSTLDALMLGVACQHNFILTSNRSLTFWTFMFMMCCREWDRSGSAHPCINCFKVDTNVTWLAERLCAGVCRFVTFFLNTYMERRVCFRSKRGWFTLKNHPVTRDQTMRRWQKRAPRCLLIEMLYIHHVFLHLKPASDTSKE